MRSESSAQKALGEDMVVGALPLEGLEGGDMSEGGEGREERRSYVEIR